MGFTTIKMTSSGQVIIPEEIRKQLKLKEGVKFIVLYHGDTVILKVISEPSKEEFKEMLDQAASDARRAGLKKSDVTAAIKRVRRSK